MDTFSQTSVSHRPPYTGAASTLLSCCSEESFCSPSSLLTITELALCKGKAAIYCLEETNQTYPSLLYHRSRLLFPWTMLSLLQRKRCPCSGACPMCHTLTLKNTVNSWLLLFLLSRTAALMFGVLRFSLCKESCSPSTCPQSSMSGDMERPPRCATMQRGSGPRLGLL